MADDVFQIYGEIDEGREIHYSDKRIIFVKRKQKKKKKTMKLGTSVSARADDIDDLQRSTSK